MTPLALNVLFFLTLRHLFIHIVSGNDTPDGRIHRSVGIILHIHLGQKTGRNLGGRRALI